MLPTTHFLLGLFLSSILIELNILSINYVIILIIITVFLDIDHVISYIYRAKNLNIKLLIKDTLTKKPKYTKRTWLHYDKGILIVMSICFMMLLIDYELSIAILLGYLLHIIADYYSLNVLELPKRKVKLKKGIPIISTHEMAISIFCLTASIALWII